ncbi:hypothetical protein GC170_00110 [bacterium]|nr:hypothetical protein [bacterium]
MRQLQLSVLILTLAAGMYSLTTGVILASGVDPVELLDFAWRFGAIALMTAVVYRQFLRPQAS